MVPDGPKQDRSRETYRKLIDTTLGIISRDGLPATTVSRVAAEAGVSRGAAQHHFPTREALLEATLHHFFADRTQQLRLAIAALDSGPHGAPVEDVLRLVLGFFTDELFTAAVHVWSAAAADESVRGFVMPAEERYSREVFQLAALSLHADLSDRATRRILAMMLDMARGIGLSAVLIEDPARVDKAVESFAPILDGVKRR